ncbi:histidine phosphatase family protein [Glycomyces buryatensis]|uniref:Histidine phosphatase family protein n=1 Tax=Glycomyces buryatensis TaxID=2570927 RepID=A0A4S8QEU4_9ACTN|nr:histidine phosphatase family protein [Glycomyces buryatensis]THV43123.1 histidine phosphatase family protein [Glycomyces buryatensis]
MGEIVLIRHGETTWSATGQHTSITDLELTDTGVAQAKGLTPLLEHRNFAAVWASPRKRASQTAELAGLAVTAVKDDLAEWAYGDYEGLTLDTIRESDPDWTIWTGGGKGPDGESAAQVERRLDRVIEAAKPLLAQGDVAFIAHGHSLRVAAARWLGRPAEDGRDFTIDTASIAALGHEHGRQAIALWNLTAAVANPS